MTIKVLMIVSLAFEYQKINNIFPTKVTKKNISFSLNELKKIVFN